MEIVKNKSCLITGGACGLGFEFALLALEDGYDLIIIDENRIKLKQAKVKLTKACKCKNKIRVILMDLCALDAADQLFNEVQHEPIEMLINNAGFGLFGKFTETQWELEERMINLHILTLTHLTKYVLKKMISNNRGKILNVSSMAAFQPGPLMAIYYASKAYLLSFSEALAKEVKNTNVTVTAFCPGPTLTDFQKRVCNDGQNGSISFNMADKCTVAKYGYEAVKHNRTVVVPGRFNKFLAFLPRILPRDLVSELVLRIQLKNRRTAIKSDNIY